LMVVWWYGGMVLFATTALKNKIVLEKFFFVKQY
jgi:hypothetical protein